MSHSKFDTVLAHKPSQNLAMSPSIPQCKCHFGVEPAVALGFAARHSGTFIGGMRGSTSQGSEKACVPTPCRILNVTCQLVGKKLKTILKKTSERRKTRQDGGREGTGGGKRGEGEGG